MTKLFLKIFIAIGLVPSVVYADFDLAFSGYTRTYPLGGSVESMFGYGAVIWGDPSSPWYGFVRAGAEVAGVEDYFSSGVRAEFFPIAFAGLRGGRSWVQNHVLYEDYDCVNFICLGDFVEDSLEVPIYFQFWQIQGLFSYQKSQWGSSSSGGLISEFIEPLSGLPVAMSESGGSSLFSNEVVRLRGMLFVNLSESWQVGYAQSNYSSCLNSDDVECESQIWQGMLRFHLDQQFSLAMGSGEYKNRFGLSEPSATLFISYSPLPKLGY